jgi:hypothetical protein
MEGASPPTHAWGLVAAVLLGVVLAVATVGVLANAPGSLTSVPAAQYANNSTDKTQIGATNSTLPFIAGSNESAAPSLPVASNSSLANSLTMNDVASALNGQKSASSNNTSSQNATQPSPTGVNALVEKVDAASLAFRDIAIFAAASVLAIGAFLVARRQMS